VLGIAAAGRPHAREARPLPPIQLSRPPGKVIFVGVDGLSSGWLASLLARGSYPSLDRVMKESASYDIRPLASTVPPEVWTSIATGVPGDIHGVRSFEVHRLLGMRSPLFAAPAARDVLGSAFRLLSLAPPEISEEAPLSSFLRRSRAIWEIAQAAGLPSAVLNWWGTWPARAESALTVSERALGSLVDSASPGAGRPAPGPCEMICPETFERRLRSEFAAERGRLNERLDRAREGMRGAGAQEAAIFDSAFTIDAYHLDVAAEVIEDSLAGAIFVYLPGQDILTGRTGRTGLTGSGGSGEGEAGERRGEAGNLARTLRILTGQQALLAELDRGVGRIADLLGPDDLLILAGDPGRRLRGEEGGSARGFVFIYGGRVAHPGPAGAGGTMDLAPTLLALCGLPQSAELPGRPLPDLDGVLTGPLGEGRVASFGDRPVPGWDPSEESATFLDELRSLGYIQ